MKRSRQPVNQVEMGPDYYDKNWRKNTPRYTEPFERAVAIGAYVVGDSVLDLACGVGGLWDVVAPRRYLGIDFSPFGIQWAREQNKNPNAEFMCCSLYDMPDVGMFDTVILIQVLEHLEDPLDVGKRALACTRRRMIVTVPDTGRPGQVAHLWERWTRKDLEDVVGKVPTKCMTIQRMLVGIWDLAE